MKISLGVVFSAMCYACIEPIHIDAHVDDPPNLIIDGFITDEFGPHNIKITTLSPFASLTRGGLNQWIENVQVSIIDQNGIITELTEGVFGNYTTPNTFKGEVGSSYTLDVTLPNGGHYFSTPQVIPEGPEIDSLILAFKKLPSADPVNFESGVEVFTQFQDPTGEANNYLWTISREIFQASNCFFSRPVEQLNTLSDARQDGELITEKVLFLVDDGMRFQQKIHVEVSQYNISAEAFEFHRLVKSQLLVEGSILDPSLGPINGNLFRDPNQVSIPDPDHPGENLVVDPDEIVFGYFGAYKVSRKGIFIPLNILGRKTKTNQF